MLGFAKWSARRKAVAAATLALLLFAPLGISENAQPVVTGHSTFYDGDGFDPCLASVAGIMRTQVMWFNDQVLVERYGGKGTYVYITENGSGDPRENFADGNNGRKLFTEGTVYDFVDPNGVSWHVDEAFFGNLEVPTQEPVPQPRVDDRFYVWIVELSAFPIHDQFAGDPRSSNYHDVYNFLDIVDTCKFHRNDKTNADGELNPDKTYDFNITHDNPDELGPGYGHPSGTSPHKHETFMADIWIGSRPVLIPVGADGVQGTATWESDWAASGQPAAGASHTGATYSNSTGADNIVP
ncbi:MAG: hypothetical protein WDA16_13910 [Candidatus Thermoplasmatota archaeon]